MQAIILAAGMGRRLGEYTRNNTKCMVPVNGVPMIDRMLGQLSGRGLKRVVIVVGYKADNLKKHIGKRYDGRLDIEFVENPVYDKTNNIYSLFLAKDKLVEDDTLLLESDLVLEDGVIDMAIDDIHPNVALVARYETWMDGTMMRLDGDESSIVNFIPKKDFDYADVDTYFKTVNVYKFSKKFSKEVYVPFLKAYSSALGNNEYYEQVLRVITLIDRSNLKALPIGRMKWYEIDDAKDLDIAQALFSSSDEKLGMYSRRYGGFWRFPGMLDYCYLVNPYFPNARMKTEMKANFDILLTEYPSGMYVNSLLSSEYFGIKHGYSVVGNGAAELIKSLMEKVEGRIGVVYPTFEEYPNRREPSEVEVFVPDNPDYRYSADDLMQFFNDKDIDALLVINPDNPSGNFIPVADMLRLANWCEKRAITLIVDESFVDFTDNYRSNSLITDEILETYPHMFVMKSISKSYGVPGLRLGVLASSDEEAVARVRKDVSIWNINSFAEFYMQIFSKYVADYDSACQKFLAERARFYKKLENISFLRVVPSQANFFLCELTGRYSSTELATILLSKYDILIKDCNFKRALEDKNYIRISIRNSHDNDRFVEALAELDK